VCQVLLSHAGLDLQWDARDPASAFSGEPAFSLSALAPASMSLVLLCWAVWDETAILAFSDVLRLGDAELELVGDLLRAIGRGHDAIDRWVDYWSLATG
jgi:hypothetical protein